MADDALAYVGLAGVLLLTLTFVVMVSRYERLLKKADKRFLDERHHRYELETKLWATKTLTGGQLAAALRQVEAIGRLVDDEESLSMEFVKIRIEEVKKTLKGQSWADGGR